jgi:formate hydrogenlyase subunit 3/multisubunit Na+/H+ antiporter MnhD subunit
MQTTKILGTVLLIAAIILGYFGVTKVANSSSEVKVLGLEIDASNESGKEKGYMLIGLAVVLFAGGLYSINKKQ